MADSPRLLSYDCRGVWYPDRRNMIDCTVHCADNLLTRQGIDGQTAAAVKAAIEEARDDATWPVTFYDIKGSTKYVKFLSAKSRLMPIEKGGNPERIYDLTLVIYELS